jgi:hypothetical protein
VGAQGNIGKQAAACRRSSRIARWHGGRAGRAAPVGMCSIRMCHPCIAVWQTGLQCSPSTRLPTMLCYAMLCYAVLCCAVLLCAGGITRVSEALEVIDKAAALDAATTAAASRASQPGQQPGDNECIEFRCGTAFIRLAWCCFPFPASPAKRSGAQRSPCCAQAGQPASHLTSRCRVVAASLLAAGRWMW